MRYLQTGDISRCAMRPAKRDPDSEMKGNSVSAPFWIPHLGFPVNSILATCLIMPVLHVTAIQLAYKFC